MKFKISLPSVLLFTLLFLVFVHPAGAGSATWNLNPTSGDWNTVSNWTPATVPNSASDTATFDVSNTTGVSLSATTRVDSIVFNSGASSFTITEALPSRQLSISGAGVVNNSGQAQSLVSNGGAKIDFANSATLGDQVTVTNNGGDITNGGSYLTFHDSASAGSATIINNPSEVGGFGATTIFQDNSTAANATIITNGDTGNGLPGYVHFRDHSNAGNATLITNGGKSSGLFGITFLDGDTGSSAANATIIANGGTNGGPGGSIYLWYSTSGGKARMEILGNGILDMSNRTGAGVTVGSIEGQGTVYLGGHTMIVGSNQLNTTFSGVIRDGGVEAGSGGALTKIGAGTLTLTGVNVYTGGTRIKAGELNINNTAGSGTGPHTVLVAGGTLSGAGFIDGMVTVGTGNGAGALLRPGNSGVTPGTLTMRKLLKLEADATFAWTFNSNTAAVDKVSANGVRIRGATIQFDDLGTSALSVGTVLTVIDNTLGSPISGNFANLADGETITIGSNTLQANYEGGDGNDLTLTVVP